MRLSLFTKILLWFFLNLLVLTAAVFLFLNFNQQLPQVFRAFNESSNAIRAVAQLISVEVREKSNEEREQILQRYAQAYQIDFLLYTNEGEKVAGKDLTLPPDILAHLVSPPPNLPPPPAPANAGERRPLPPLPPFQAMKFQSDNPRLYWAVVRVPLFEKGQTAPTRASLIAVTDVRAGHGLFYDPVPWVWFGLGLFLLSILLWIPFVRSLTISIRQMTNATEQIAEENFAVRVAENRHDEIGRLGAAINHLTARLSGFVTGQKRFLGDISHELNSPLARMQFALSILEERVEVNQRGYVADVQEEVNLMAKLVNELLTYSKAGMKRAEISLTKTLLLPIVAQAVAREITNKDAVAIIIPENLAVLAQPELLARALGNILRNADRYAGHAGAITITAHREKNHVQIIIADSGPGVPEESVSKLFDPFYRLATDRARASGGTGLGLAIVKTCVESCQGTVIARNRQPSGLEIIITLKA